MESLKKAIVITSIFEPTEAVVSFSKLSDYHLIVVGDKKSPQNWHCDNVEYLSVDRQETLPYQLSKVLPFNHYCRKMLGYLAAIGQKAAYIIDTDDDNYPKGNWDFPVFESEFDMIDGPAGFVNIYQYYTKQKIWPRGLPLDLINTDFQIEKFTSRQNCNVGIWQGLADEDPDVDAIYRLTDNTPCYFDDKPPIVLNRGTVCPFNTQNTIIRKELFALLYLPTYVTFRFTDILRGLVAQPVMWLYGYQLGFINATVVQKRNLHNYMDDFTSEIPMYQHCNKIVDLVTTVISADNTVEVNLLNAYKALLENNIVCEKEIITLESWLADITSLQ
ncbi:hypothetical protein FHW88_002010 [Mucilaginibacter sp. SG538B]|uniref:STELLO glycosyltransferase family protein n=1 Tax=Mucilaginibacter sp. SG538B TaxID=2587021 RepID=UPI00159E2817|nr:STELLO glycosyltransferase family protein [Mucilaginibacter sp. SG538B]NVM63721.1 hypothetical protein [Mucilaginibacter sp. SG538B]